MQPRDIAAQRLGNQQLLAARAATPAEAVAWQGAMQAQDYAGAKWALGQRLHGATDAMLDTAFAEGAILRTHVLRPTWHFVAPADIRWMLELSAPRVHALNAYYYRQLGLDDDLFARSGAALAEALAGGNHLTRGELQPYLLRAGIPADGLRLTYLVMHAELERRICSGPRRGKQFTYALLSERAPGAQALGREAALAELALRYFQSHGPATVHDFVWWASMGVAESRAALETLEERLVRETFGGKEYWRAPSVPAELPSEPVAHLLPNYDECLASYRDRSASAVGAGPSAVDRLAFPHHLSINGQLAGCWKRAPGPKRMTLELQLFRPLAPAERHALNQAVERYSQFLQQPVAIEREAIVT